MTKKKRTPDESLVEPTNHDLIEKPTGTREELSNYLRPLQPFITERERIGNAELLRRYKHSTDHKERRAARKTLIYGNVPLIVKTALVYVDRGVPLLDLVQEGVLGLMKAIDKFQCDKGFALSTYATHWIWQSITRAIDEASATFPYRIPIHVQEEIRLVRRVMHTIHYETGRWPDDDEIFDRVQKIQEDHKTKMSRAHAIRCREYILAGQISFDEIYYTESSTEPATIAEVIGDNHAYSNVGILIQAKDQQRLLRRQIAKILLAIKKLPSRQSRILPQRLGLNGRKPMTLEKIGKQVHLTRERVRQLELAGWATIEAQTGFGKKQMQQALNSVELLDHMVKSVN